MTLVLVLIGASLISFFSSGGNIGSTVVVAIGTLCIYLPIMQDQKAKEKRQEEKLNELTDLVNSLVDKS